MNNTDAIYMLSDQINALNDRITKLQDLTYVQVLLMAANNSLLDENKRVMMFNQAMALIERTDLRVQGANSQVQNTASQELPTDLIR